MVNPLVNQTIANSRAVLERIVESESIPLQRICVVYNGIDLSQMRSAPELRSHMRRSLGIEDGQILVGNISGLREIKGVQMFVDAAAEAYRRDSRLRFILVGDGEMKPQLERAISGYGLEQIIRLTGAAEDVRPYLAALDVAVLCSRAEGFSNSLLEYMACGVPAIATDVGGNHEALGSSGLLIRPDVHDLARAIQRMTDLRVRKSFAANGIIRVRQFDLAVAQTRMANIYANCLGSVAPRRRRLTQLITHMLARPLNSESA